VVYLRVMDFVVNLVVWFAAYGLQALIFCAVALLIIVPVLGLLFVIRAVWRRVSPYEPPAGFDPVLGLRDRLEQL
jgi:hypothetical protein